MREIYHNKTIVAKNRDLLHKDWSGRYLAVVLHRRSAEVSDTERDFR
jgi:hypothetical protein